MQGHYVFFILYVHGHINFYRRPHTPEQPQVVHPCYNSCYKIENKCSCISLTLRLYLFDLNCMTTGPTFQ